MCQAEQIWRMETGKLCAYAGKEKTQWMDVSTLSHHIDALHDTWFLVLVSVLYTMILLFKLPKAKLYAVHQREPLE